MRFHGSSTGLMVTALIAMAACTGGIATAPDAGSGTTAIAADAQAKASGSAGRIACDAPEHDWGSIMVGQEATHTFVVKNVGDGVLRILTARGG